MGKIVFFFAMFAASKGENRHFALVAKNKKIKPLYICGMERARYTATLASMGLRAEASLAKHLLLENCWENNLLPDISKVDYFEGHQGRTNLQPLEGLPLFVDDIYICGYLDQTEVVRARGALSCEPVSKQIVQRISMAVQEVLGGPRKNTRISNTVFAASRGSKIVETIAKIESDTRQRARRQWKRLFPEKEVFACFVAKVDVSAVDIGHLQERLPTLARLLESRGDSMYEIDYTQNFSGMVDRNALVSHLLANGFAMQGSGEYSDKGTILANRRSVGEHVCTWLHTERGYTVRTKIYNKLVSQFEAGEVNETFGGHLGDYVDCPNQHMRRTFEHPAVQARGCTRIEVSFYGSEALSTQTGEALVAAALAEVQVENEENGLFVVQPPRHSSGTTWPSTCPAASFLQTGPRELYGWAAAGGSGQTNPKDSRKGGCLGKSDTLYYSRLRLSQLSYLRSRNFGR